MSEETIDINPRIDRRKDKYEARSTKDGWTIFNVTQGRTLFGLYGTIEAAERTIKRIKTALGPRPRSVLRALILKGKCTPNELALSAFPDTFDPQFCKSEYVNRALKRLCKLNFVKHEREDAENVFEDVWDATDQGRAYAAV